MHLAIDTRRAFARWLRTGHLPPIRRADGLELKFNPYHDPINGQFTFAPGGSAGGATAAGHGAGLTAEPAEPMARGANARAMERPMTLQQVFPGLQGAPGGAIIAVADNFLNFVGPVGEAQAELLRNWTRQTIADIRALDPQWHPDGLGIPADPTTVEGMQNQLNGLRWQRATAIARVKGDYRPLQVETLRFIQQRADAAYAEGEAMLKAGKLTPRLHEREALGNFIDRQVRAGLRSRYASLGIESGGAGPVRVNRRENDTSGSDTTYRRPDVRVGNVAFDVTLSQKTLKTAQVREFFNVDFRPSQAVIVRPSQLGSGHTYIIARPGSR